MERGALLTNQKAIMQGVRISVEAESDVHLSLSSNNPITTDSWDIVLGAMSGTMTLLRRSHQG